MAGRSGRLLLRCHGGWVRGDEGVDSTSTGEAMKRWSDEAMKQWVKKSLSWSAINLDGFPYLDSSSDVGFFWGPRDAEADDPQGDPSALR